MSRKANGRQVQDTPNWFYSMSPETARKPNVWDAKGFTVGGVFAVQFCSARLQDKSWHSKRSLLMWVFGVCVGVSLALEWTDNLYFESNRASSALVSVNKQWSVPVHSREKWTLLTIHYYLKLFVTGCLCGASGYKNQTSEVCRFVAVVSMWNLFNFFLS